MILCDRKGEPALKWHYCRYCDRIQRFRPKCSSCNKRCEEVDVPRHSAQTATPLVAIPIFIAGIVGFIVRSYIHSFVEESDICCTVIMLLYFMVLVCLITFSIFNYFRYRKWTKDVAREMVEDGVVVEEGDRERPRVFEAEVLTDDDYRVPRKRKRKRPSRRKVRERPPPRRRGRKPRRRRTSYDDGEEEYWDADDDWLY
jgi:hypothetical protein